MFKITTNPQRSYKRIAILGDPSIGKTTSIFKMYSNPFVINMNDRIPRDVKVTGIVTEVIKKFYDLEEGLKSILKGESFPSDAIVFDHIGNLEQVCRERAQMEFKSLKEYNSYQTGDQNFLPQYFQSIINLSDAICEKFKCDCVLIGHTTRKSAKNPIGEDYEKVGMEVTKYVEPLITQWADWIGYAHKLIIRDDSISSKNVTKIVGNDTRIITFKSSPLYPAKASPNQSQKMLDEYEFDIDGKWYKNTIAFGNNSKPQENKVSEKTVETTNSEETVELEIPTKTVDLDKSEKESIIEYINENKPKLTPSMISIINKLDLNKQSMTSLVAMKGKIEQSIINR